MALLPIHDITSSDTRDLDNVGSPSYAGLLNVDTFCSVVSKKILFVSDISDLIKQAMKYQKVVMLTVGSMYFPRV